MTKISIHQSGTGRWYVSTTHNGYDVVEEGRTIEEAKENITILLNDNCVPSRLIEFSEPKYYPEQPTDTTPNIGLKERPKGIDNHPFA